MSHNFHNKDPAVRGRRRVNTVNRICCDLRCTLKTEGLIRSIQIIVYGLWKRNDIQPLLTQKVRGFLTAVPSQHTEAVELQPPIGRLHQLYPIITVLIRNRHLLKGLTACSEHRSAPREYAGKIALLHTTEIPVHQTPVAVKKAYDLCLLIQIVERLCDAAQRRIQSLAVSSAGQKPDTNCLSGPDPAA